ncbi:hypothetical protein COS83_00955 [archaeon CG07_land_8_20_14_0_80_38_8]|nr:MAG: hypothetical protein COS83_00955 [archaeon CG07_land_8_20_14_0_80_38_8]PIU88708.1 MAG: hypothetical protein COS64_02790 [archaeon CG06_land_8_20_14_3_00_37_11]
MVVKHRRKSSRKKGYNHRQGLRRRGSGNRGGVGRAGLGKRCKQKKHKFMKNGKLGYGKNGFTSIHEQPAKINVGELSAKAGKLGEEKKGKYYINANRMKVLGKGSVRVPIVLSNYKNITENAKEKIIKAGGEVAEK